MFENTTALFILNLFIETQRSGTTRRSYKCMILVCGCVYEILWMAEPKTPFKALKLTGALKVQ